MSWILNILQTIVFIAIVLVMFQSFSDHIVDCTEEDIVKYRIETRGFFGDEYKMRLPETSKNFDGYTKVCVRGKNFFGDIVEAKK